jgi:hypothetical protein
MLGQMQQRNRKGNARRRMSRPRTKGPMNMMYYWRSFGELVVIVL